MHDLFRLLFSPIRGKSKTSRSTERFVPFALFVIFFLFSVFFFRSMKIYTPFIFRMFQFFSLHLLLPVRILLSLPGTPLSKSFISLFVFFFLVLDSYPFSFIFTLYCLFSAFTAPPFSIKTVAKRQNAQEWNK